MAKRSAMVPWPWKVVLVALFLLGMSLPLHEKLERRREERTALRAAISRHLTP